MTLAFHSPGSADGWLRRRDARWKIAGFVVAIVATICLGDPFHGAVAALASIVLAVAGAVRARTLILRLLPVVGMLLLFFVWPIFQPRPEETPWTLLGLSLSPIATQRLAAILAKTIAIVTLVLTLFETTPLPEFGQGATRLGVPRLFVHLVLLTQRYVFVLAEEFTRLRRALRVRGYRNRFDRRSFATIANVAGALFVRGHETAERVHHAMAARGFDGTFRSLSQPRTNAGDVVFFVATLFVAGFALSWDRGWLPL